MKITHVAVKELYPLVEKCISSHTPAYKKNIQHFLEVRSEDIYDTVPCKRIPFSTQDADDFFDAIKLNKASVTECLTHTYYWNMNFNPRAAKDEFTMAMMMVIRYFILKNDSKNAEISAIYLAFSGKFYPSIHSGKFKIPPDKYRHVMEYVVNNMLTNKYDLKKYGSVFGAIRSICQTWLKTYNSKFKDPDDEDVADMIQQLHGRIKSFLGNIATMYYKAYENRDQYLTYGSDSDDENSFRISDSDSLLAERCVENAMNYVTSKGVDYKLCSMAADKNVHVDEVKSIIESIQDDKDNLVLIRELFSITISLYFSESKEKDVRSMDFVTKSISAKPNTKNKDIIRQKQIIETWLDENSPQYRKRRSRPDTKSSYNKSILIYYVLVINYANK